LHSGYSCLEERLHQFWFLYTLFVFELGGHTGQTDGGTDGHDAYCGLLGRQPIILHMYDGVNCVIKLHGIMVNVQVTGVIQDSAGHVRYVLSGTWDDKLEGAPVLNTIESSKGKVMYETGETKVLWQRRYPP